MERFIGLDIGDRRIGVAVSDPLGITAQPVETYNRLGFGPDLRHFRDLCERYETKSFVCGLPRNMDGTEGEQANKVRLFAEQLEKNGFEVWFEDERLTTVMAEGALLEANLHRDGRKRKVDMVAAVLILQSFLDRLSESASDKDDRLEGDDTILELEDEEGNALSFRISARVSFEGAEYLLLDETEDTEDGNFFFLQKFGDGDTVTYRSVEDRTLLEKLYSLYLVQSEQENE